MTEKTRQSKFSTEDYEEPDRKVINAGSIDEEGIEVVFESEPQAREGSYGTYWSVEVGLVLDDGTTKPAVINFSGKKLHELIESNWDALEGEQFLVWAEGEKFDRQYHIA